MAPISTTGGKGHLFGVVANMGRAVFGRQHHLGAGQLGRIIGEMGDREPRGRQKTVPLGGVARHDAIDVEGYDVGARLIRKDAQDRLQGPHPAQRSRPPTHGFRPWEFPDHTRHDLGDDVAGRATRPFDHGEKHLALLVGAGLQLVARQPGTAHEALDRGLGRIGARTAAFFAGGRRLRAERFKRQNQAPRRRKNARAGIGQPRRDQAVGHKPLQIFGGARLHPGWNFLGEQFEEKIGHGATS
jgi:hypothetical protein